MQSGHPLSANAIRFRHNDNPVFNKKPLTIFTGINPDALIIHHRNPFICNHVPQDTVPPDLHLTSFIHSLLLKNHSIPLPALWKEFAVKQNSMLTPLDLQ